MLLTSLRGTGPAFLRFPRRQTLTVNLIFESNPQRDCRCASFLGTAIRCSLLEKHTAEIGAMNLRVTHGARLILRRLIVCRTASPDCQSRRS